MDGHTPDGDAVRRRLDFTDAELLAECEVHTYRASGPGGQKRNKTLSAVRLHHGPSGLIVPAVESRSQHENKARALRRLREAIAVQFRATSSTSPDWPADVVDADGCLHVGRKHPQRITLLAAVLDVVGRCHGRLRETADECGVTATSLTRFLAEHPKAWAEANRIRQVNGLSPLRTPG